MHFVAVAAAKAGGDDRLADAVDKYRRRYKELSWFKRWSITVQTAKAQRLLDKWLGRRKAPE